MSDDTNRLAASAAALRAIILDPSEFCGPSNPVAPRERHERLRGAEFVGWDARRDACMLMTPLLDHTLTDPVVRAVTRAIEEPTARRLRSVEAALRSPLPRDAEQACRLVADVLPFHMAALGCERASGYIAAAALDAASMRIDCGDFRHAYLSLRCALLWSSDAQADATDLEYVGGPLAARLAAFDQRAHVWLKAFRVFSLAESLIADEDAILRGGAGVPSDGFDLGLGAGGPVPLSARRAPSAGRTLVVFPSLRHLPKPSTSQQDRGDSPRALAEAYAEKGMPLTPAPDPRDFADRLRARFPWASEAIEAYATDLVGAPYAAFRPRILVGPPGYGKTQFARAVIEEAGLDVTVYAAAGMMDGGAFGGTSRQWGSWRLSVPAQAIVRARQASVGVVVDEVEKAGTSRRWGRLDETILPFLERGSTARAMHDPALETALDLSAVSYVLTANSLAGIVGPLLDRAPALHWPAPRAEDMPIVAAAILAEIRRDRGLDEMWCHDLDGEELNALTAWRGGSLRPLRRMVETIVAARDVLARRMPN